jgi:hypothetical protein
MASPDGDEYAARVKEKLAGRYGRVAFDSRADEAA